MFLESGSMNLYLVANGANQRVTDEVLQQKRGQTIGEVLQ